MKGYKVFNPDWTCRGFQFGVGKTFTEDVTPVCCEIGFHFCTKVADCFKYYDFSPDNKVAEVEALGDIGTNDGGRKYSTNKIHIIREFTWQEVLDLVNPGKGCTGFRNSGDWNSGDWNSGDWNSGDWNSGDWNKANFSNGCFNTKEPKIYLFNKPSDWTYKYWLGSDARHLLSQINGNILEWVSLSDMTDEEKEKHQEAETTGGYLKTLDGSECGLIWWDRLSKDEKNTITSIPNFDKEIFKEITGIDIGEETGE